MHLASRLSPKTFLHLKPPTLKSFYRPPHIALLQVRAMENAPVRRSEAAFRAPLGPSTVACVPREIAALVDRDELASCMGLTESTKRADASQSAARARGTVKQAMNTCNAVAPDRSSGVLHGCSANVRSRMTRSMTHRPPESGPVCSKVLDDALEACR